MRLTARLSGYCDPCQRAARKQADAVRPSARKRGYTRAWEKYRAEYLRDHPFCVLCRAQGRRRLATVVDHIQDHKQNRRKFEDPRNHQSLCVQCHNRKSGRSARAKWRID